MSERTWIKGLCPARFIGDGDFPLDPNATNASGYTITLTSGHRMSFKPGHGPLWRLQDRLQQGRLWWCGNRVSDLRYWLWWLCR